MSTLSQIMELRASVLESASALWRFAPWHFGVSNTLKKLKARKK